MLTRLPSLLAVFILWLLHFLPFPLLVLLGRSLGRLLHFFARGRRRVAQKNIDLCFPELPASERRRLTRKHFALLGRSMLERSILWWSSEARIRRLITVEGEERIHAERAAGRPVILLAPHFLGLDAGGVAMAQRFDSVSVYSKQSNPVFNQVLFRGRSRFGDQLLLSREESIRATVRAMKSGRPFYYLPDLNARRPGAVFVPFFGLPAATITGLSRLSKVAGATVIPCITQMHSGGYKVKLLPPWENFPTDDPEADTARMNVWIEAAVRRMPEQYYWVHRRFKNRPPGEARFY